MREVAWMAGAAIGSWLAVSAIGGDRVNPESAFGMAGPLAATSAVVARDCCGRTAVGPSGALDVMIVGVRAEVCLLRRLMWWSMLRLLELEPVPFVTAFVKYFIGLYAMQALFLKRLTAVK